MFKKIFHPTTIFSVPFPLPFWSVLTLAKSRTPNVSKKFLSDSSVVEWGMPRAIRSVGFSFFESSPTSSASAADSVSSDAGLFVPAATGRGSAEAAASFLKEKKSQRN